MLGNFPQAFTHVSLVNTAGNISSATRPALHRAAGTDGFRVSAPRPPATAELAIPPESGDRLRLQAVGGRKLARGERSVGSCRDQPAWITPVRVAASTSRSSRWRATIQPRYTATCITTSCSSS